MSLSRRVGRDGRTIACIASAAGSLRFLVADAVAASQALMENFSTLL
jgi:hypothetical protein